MQPPSMGVNGFGRRSHNFSTPSLVDYRSQPHHYGSQPSIVQNGGSQSPPDYALLFDQPVVVLRSKKPSTVRSAKEESRLRSQQPPSNIQRVQAIRSRPQSTASYNSLASSGMENLQWRNSVMSSVTPDNRRHTLYDEEDNPRVARLEYFQGEESEMLKRGQDQASKLLEWYKERLLSVQKKARLLQQGSVSLDPAVHEQKLNFLRAHITELNRRILAVMETSDKGFPAHHNRTTSNGPANGANDDQLVWLHRQNQRLNQELAEKTQMIDQLKRENELVKKSQIQRVERSVPILRPSAFVRPAYQVPTIINNNNHPKNPSPLKIYDTLM